MSKSHYRASAQELAMQSQIFELMMAVSQLTQSVKMALPHAPMPDVGTFRSFGNALDLHGGSLPDEMLLAGRGPRFVALYHLAESDEERQVLLDTLLPEEEGFHTSSFETNLDVMTSTYPLRLSDGYNHMRGESAPEFDQWLNAARETGRFKSIEVKDLREVADLYTTRSRHSGSQSEWQLNLTWTIQTFSWTPPPRENRDTYGRLTEPTVLDPVELFLVPVPEHLGFVLIELVKMDYGSGRRRWVPRYRHWLTWSEIEKKWCLTNGKFFPPKMLSSVAERFLQFVGMPKYDMPSQEELVGTCARLHALIEEKFEAWKPELAMNGPLEYRQISLPGVMSLTFRRRPTWSYSDNDPDRVCYQILDERLFEYGVAPEIPAFRNEGSRRLPLIRTEENRNGELEVKGTLGVHNRHYRSVLTTFNQFLESDPNTWVVTDKTSGSPSDVD